MSADLNLNDEQIEIILSDLIEHYGYDFTNYSAASLKRRIQRLLTMDKIVSFAEFRHRIQHDAEYFKRFVEQITVNVTEMFRDAHFYRALREHVIPELATRPLIRIWHAGCSTGEEVYSMAILLHEANLLHKSLLYATDINPAVLEKVRLGMFPMSQMKQYSENYIHSGGRNDFSKYYIAQYDTAKFDESFKSRIILATHNLVSDTSFNEFQLILCRNVMIYFDKDLQDRALELFDNSLEKLGYLCLGSKETLKFSSVMSRYKQIESKEKIWRKVS